MPGCLPAVVVSSEVSTGETWARALADKDLQCKAPSNSTKEDLLIA